MSREWTPQQNSAITSTGGTILVSAAAGSGKTAVLVERVIRMITDPEHPVDADRLLVVTFTRDAAAEMKQRIANALSDLLEKDPFNQRLLRQSRLLYTASISTIDSFCGELVKEYFHSLGVSADYRIADFAELELMKAAAMDAAIEDFYNNGGAAFLRLCDAFSGKGGDLNLRDTVLKIHEFLETQPFPERWLDELLECYRARDIADSVWGRIITDHALPAVSHCVNLCENSLRQLSDADEKLKEKLSPIIEEDLVYFHILQEKLLGESWDAMVNAVRSPFAAKQLRAPNAFTNDPVKLAVAANRKNAKDTVARLKDIFCRTEQEAAAELSELRELVGVLFDLTRAYIARLDEIKRKKNVMTFADIELLTVKLLAEYDSAAGYRKTAQGEEISARYDAVIVDEFQDVNDVQSLIFNCVSKNETNLFTVGDVKQCIYGFRQAKPQIFVGRKESYPRFDPAAPAYPATIILDKNFRSRREVCDTVNFIFSRLMQKDTAQMDYTREEYLNAGASYIPQEGCETELCLIDSADFDGEDNLTLEAQYIARRIRTIMASGFLVTDGDIRRRPTYGDFAVMLRSAKRSAAQIVKVLLDNGIPAFSEEKESAFDSTEVKLMLDLLRVIDNPALDIPLLAVLCSPIYGFTPDELAQIRAKNRRVSLYAALEAYRRSSEKTDGFLRQLKALRSYSYVCTVDELIGRVLETTSLGAVTCAVSSGDAPLQNLNLLRHFARGFEAGSSKTLSDFIFYIDRLIDNGVELPSASANDAESLNGVRVLSVHKSKGLEYPFCFLAGTAKRINKSDLGKDVLIDNHAGLGIRRKVGVCRYNTLPRLAVEIEIERNEIAEELRVLYVALTRAREKLIIVGALSGVPDYIRGMAAQMIFGSQIDPYTVTGAKRILDWLTLCALANPSSRAQMLPGSEQIALRGDYPEWKFVLVNDPEQIAFPREQSAENQASPLPEAMASQTDYAELLRQNLAFEYPFDPETRLPQKVSASQIAHAQSGDYFEKVIVKPRFLNERGTSAVERGTAHHLLLQYCDFARAREDIDAEIDRLRQENVLSEAQAELVDRKALGGLLKSGLFDRVLQSPRVWREERFTVKIAPSQVFEDSDDDTPVIVMQGAVDLAFEENGRLVIVDYKTDRVRDIRKLAALYKKQLELYRAALEQSLEMKVSECIICSVALNDSITV